MFSYFLKKINPCACTNDSEVVVPLHDANHWSVVVMSSESLIHYDLLSFTNLFQSTTLHRFLTKVWVAM
jgi:hypothetical protein